MEPEAGSRKIGWPVVEALLKDVDEMVDCAAGTDAGESKLSKQRTQLTSTLNKEHEDGVVCKVVGRDGSRHGQVVGYANWIKENGQWELQGTFVHQAYHRLNIGNYLMEDGLKRIGNHSVIIKEATEAGENLYKPHGFEVTGKTPGGMSIGGTPEAGSATMERKPAERDLQAWRSRKGIEKSP